jgi:3-phytase
VGWSPLRPGRAGNNRIQVFNPLTGRALRAIGGKGTAPGKLDHPEGLCVDAKRGLVYVVDTGNFRIQAFTNVIDASQQRVKKLHKLKHPDGSLLEFLRRRRSARS